MSEKDDGTVELDCKITKETRLALLCNFGDKEVWIPKSQVDDNSRVCSEGDEGIIIISEWIAQQRGLI